MTLTSTVRPVGCAFLCGALFLPGVAAAAITIYTDRATFLSATSSTGLDNLNNLESLILPPPANGGSLPYPLVRQAGSFSYTATRDQTGRIDNPPFDTFNITIRSFTVSIGDYALGQRGTDAINRPLYFDTFTPGVNAFGGDMFGTGFTVPAGVTFLANYSANLRAVATNVSGESETQDFQSGPGRLFPFVGFISTTPLSRVTFYAFDFTPPKTDPLLPESTVPWATIDNVLVGMAPMPGTTVVPVPASLPLMAGGLAMLGLGLRRRRTTH